MPRPLMSKGKKGKRENVKSKEKKTKSTNKNDATAFFLNYKCT